MPHPALSIIAAEHRSLAAVLSSLQFLIQDIRGRGIEPDFELLSVILDYIDVFPERVHHPKEDQYLFKLLRNRTDEANIVLDELQAEHAKGDELIRNLRREQRSLVWTEAAGSASQALSTDRASRTGPDRCRSSEASSPVICVTALAATTPAGVVLRSSRSSYCA